MTHTSLKSLFTGIADAIRSKEGSTDAIVADDFPDRIANMQTGDTEVEDVLISGKGNIGTYTNNRVTKVRRGAFQFVPVNTVIMGAVRNLEENTFEYSINVTRFVLKAVDCLPSCCMQGCEKLEIVDINGGGGILELALSGCRRLKALILRNSDPSNMGGLYTSSPENDSLAGSNTTVYIYVPRAMVESYKVYSGWVHHADRIRALEDYTVDGTITGDLDESKI